MRNCSNGIDPPNGSSAVKISGVDWYKAALNGVNLTQAELQ
jgi:hypothetical protein